MNKFSLDLVNHQFTKSNAFGNRFIFGSSKNDRPGENWMSLSDDPSVYPFLNKRTPFGHRASTSEPLHISDANVSPASKYRFNIKQATENESSHLFKEEIEDFVDNSQSKYSGDAGTSRVAETDDMIDVTDNISLEYPTHTDSANMQELNHRIYPGVSSRITGNDLTCTTNNGSPQKANEPDIRNAGISIMELAQNPNFKMNPTRSTDMPLVSPMQWLSGVKIPVGASNDSVDHQGSSASRQRKHMLRGGLEERLANLIPREKSDHTMWAHGLRREDYSIPTIRHPSFFLEVYHVKEAYGTTICRCRQLPFDANDEKTMHFNLPPLEDEFIDILLSLEFDSSHRIHSANTPNLAEHFINVGDLVKVYKPYQEFDFDSSSTIDEWEIPRKGLIVTRFVISTERGFGNSDMSDFFRDKNKAA
ncbi:hypothetical protein K7432_000294 [Basidiobolus ranarum]